MKLSLVKNEGTISVDYSDVVVPKWFRRVFRDTALTFYYSVLKSQVQIVTDLAPELRELLQIYNYEMYLDSVRLLGSGDVDTGYHPALKLANGRHVVMLSGGMDSVHLLISLLEAGIRQCDILCIYVDNMSRSQAHYEREAVAKVAKWAGVKYRIVGHSTSVKSNQTGHNIGLREQFTLGVALPYIIGFDAATVHYGLYEDFYDIEAAIVTSNKKCFDRYCAYLSRFGVDINIAPHPRAKAGITDMDVARDLVVKHRPVLNLLSSCYTQINWREQHGDRLRALFPDFGLYWGCGYCIKCLKINTTILLYDSEEISAVRRNDLRRWILERVSQDKFSEEETAKRIKTLLNEAF